MTDFTKDKELRALIKELEKIRGRHTELITIYVPAGFNLPKVVDQVRSEQSTAQNIKSKAVRKNVLGALEKITQHLKLYKQTPPNGVVIFCGNVSDKEGVTDMELWAIETEEPIRTRLYRCDQTFILDPLKDIVREKEIYGIVVLDKSEAIIGILKGKKIEKLKSLDSIVPGKTKAGGWSANRYARIREGLLNDFLKKVGEIATAQFKEYGDLKGVLIAGPGPVKDMFVEGEFMDYTLRDKTIGVVNTSYTGEFGLREAVENAEDILTEASVIREKKLLDRYFTELEKDSGLSIYGFREVIEALNAGNVELLLLSEVFDWVKVEFACDSCGEKFSRVVNRNTIDAQKCKCGARPTVLEEKELTEEIIKMAETFNTQAEVVSVYTQRGEQLKEMGGIGAILRYKQ